jgi:hypothetical protein
MRGSEVPPAGGKVLLAVVVFALLGMLTFYLVAWFFGIKPIVEREKAENPPQRVQETPR